MSDDVQNADDTGLILGFEQPSVFVSRRYHKQVSREENEEDYVPLWLLTFADVMALMLTFFVLLYSMSTLDEERWDKMSTAVNKGVGESLSASFKNGENQVIEISRIDTRRDLSISYLKTLVVGATKSQPALEGAIIKQMGDDSLIISLPSEMIFSQGQVDMNADGKRALFALAPILSRIRNRIEIIGHADPSPINNPVYTTNRALSLARAMSVADALRQSGYDKPIITKGLSSSRYNELPNTIDEDMRMSIARRVDIVILKDTPIVLDRFNIENSNQ